MNCFILVLYVNAIKQVFKGEEKEKQKRDLKFKCRSPGTFLEDGTFELIIEKTVEVGRINELSRLREQQV